LNAILASWKGKERLWKVFWIYNWLFGTAVGIGVEAASKALPVPAFLVVAVLVLIWAVWVTVSLWRCAFNSSWRGWGYIVRAIVVLAVIAIVFAVIGIFLDDDVA
jgi:hypothetical protein